MHGPNILDHVLHTIFPALLGKALDLGTDASGHVRHIGLDHSSVLGDTRAEDTDRK